MKTRKFHWSDRVSLPAIMIFFLTLLYVDNNREELLWADNLRFLSAMWSLIISGLAINALHVMRWITKKPAPGGFFNLGLSLFVLSQIVPASTVLLWYYTNIDLPLYTIGKGLFFLSGSAMVLWCIEPMRKRS